MVGCGRRKFLKTTGTALTIGLTGVAGCLDNQSNNTATTEQHTSQEATVQNTTSNDPLEQTHQADNLDGVVQELEQDSVPLNFVPADEDADYAQSNIFDQYSDNSNALTVEVDLNQTMQQRHHVDSEKVWGDTKRGRAVKEFSEKIDDPEWREGVLETAKDNYGEEYENVVDWDAYTDQSLSFGERMKQSGMMTFWYIYERENFNGISSTNNQFKAHAFQGALKEIEKTKTEFDTFISDFRVPSHGLVAAIENPTRKKEETGKQQPYIIETDPGDGQQVTRMENSQYQDDEPFNGKNNQNKKESLLKFTALENIEGDLYNALYTSDEVEDQFVEYFHNPETEPAHDYIDPMNAAAYIAEENILKGDLQGQIELGNDEIRIVR